MENESLKDENRDLLFQGEDESEKESLRQDIHSLEEDNAHLKEDMANLTSRNQELEKELVIIRQLRKMKTRCVWNSEIKDQIYLFAI